jgi:pyridoxal biosynthesis lyase PdxS
VPLPVVEIVDVVLMLETLVVEVALAACGPATAADPAPLLDSGANALLIG